MSLIQYLPFTVGMIVLFLFTITNKIRKIPGITSTVTLLVIDEQGGKESI
jgi:hypothetical protein